VVSRLGIPIVVSLSTSLPFIPLSVIVRTYHGKDMQVRVRFFGVRILLRLLIYAYKSLENRNISNSTRFIIPVRVARSFPSYLLMNATYLNYITTVFVPQLSTINITFTPFPIISSSYLGPSHL